MTATSSPTTFCVYRWKNPATTSDYPYLAVAEDRSAVLWLGNYGLGFDWHSPEQAAPWLSQDFEPTGESLTLDLSQIKESLTTTFRGGAEFGMVTFDRHLSPSILQLSLCQRAAVGVAAEYLIEGFGSYQRVYRDPEELEPVVPSERAMLDFCVSTFAQFAGQCDSKLKEPPPPRYRVTPPLDLIN